MVGVGYWGRSNVLYCTDPKVQLTSLTEVLMGGQGGLDGALRGLVEGWAGLCVHHSDYHMWISEGLAGDATGVMIYDTMGSDQAEGGSLLLNTKSRKGKASEGGFTFLWGRRCSVLALPEQVICHGVKGGESLRHLTMNGRRDGGCWPTFAFWEQCPSRPMHIISCWCKSLSAKCKKGPLYY